MAVQGIMMRWLKQISMRPPSAKLFIGLHGKILKTETKSFAR
jgi:hypothetical protein